MTFEPAVPVSGRRLRGLARFRRRLTEPRFWYIQAGVVLVTGGHALAELLEQRGQLPAFLEGVNHFPVEAYVIPVALAGLWYGMEGGIATGIEITVLSLPNLLAFHESGYEWLGELLANTFVVMVGVALALVVERERRTRRRAVAMSRRLGLLREIGVALARFRDTSSLAGAMLDQLTAMPRFGGAAFIPAPALGAVATMTRGSAEARIRIAQAIEHRIGTSEYPRLGTVPGIMAIPVGAHPVRLGLLVVALRPELSPVAGDYELLELVAGEVAVALDNVRLQEIEREGLERYARQITEAQEEERKRIARELHDDAAQSLVVVVRGLNQLAAEADLPAVARSRVDEITEVTRGVLRSVRRTSRALRPSVLDDLGLVAAMESLIEKRIDGRIPEMALAVEGTPRRLEGDVELTAFRIAQEAITNVREHARANRVDVTLEFKAKSLRVAVVDDGRGFNSADPLPLAGLGMIGMRERADLIGGKLKVKSRPGQGTRVEFRVKT